jgi:hypothetical protein
MSSGVAPHHGFEYKLMVFFKENLMRLFLVILSFAVLMLSAEPAQAGKLYAANNGVDSADCGEKSNPCRSISHTVTRGSSGDQIVVGPGVYGDINNDGDLEDDGEENALGTDEAMISISSAIKLFSRDGAKSTVIRGVSTKSFAVYLKSSEVLLGKNKRGFTITGGSKAALFVEGSNTSISANKLYSNDGHGILVGCIPSDDENTDPDFRGFSSSGTLQHNILNHNGMSGAYFCENTASWNLSNNESSHNSAHGAYLQGANHSSTRNVFTDNALNGMRILGAPSLTVLKTVIDANGSSGVSIGDSPNSTLKKSSIIGNTGTGVFISEGVTISKSNILGNLPTDNTGGGYLNCGVFDNTSDEGQLNQNYWGSADGPAANEPADDVCSQVKTPSITDFLGREKRVPAPRPKQ